MKPNRSKRKICTLAILLLLATFSSRAQAPGAGAWQVVGPGGGGTTIGPTISPYDSNLVVEHCDMTGGYITRDNGQSWRMFNLRSGIAVLAFDPADAQVIYAGNAALWRSGDSGRSWKMLFPNPNSNTVEHQITDHSDYLLTSSDPAYPGGEISAIAIAEQKNHGSPEHLYLSFLKRGQPAVIVHSADGGATWSRLATLPQRVLQLVAQDSGLIALSGSAAYRIAPDGVITQLGDIGSAIRAASVAHSGSAMWIYATGQDGKVYISEDSGQHWRTATPALQQSGGRFEAIAANDRHPEIAYAGFRNLQLADGKQNTFNGIAKTTDGGRNWQIVFKESILPNATGACRRQSERELDRAARAGGQRIHLCRFALLARRRAHGSQRGLCHRSLPYLSHLGRRRQLAAGELAASERRHVDLARTRCHHELWRAV